MRIKILRGVSEVQLKKTRLLHFGNVEKRPHPQFLRQLWLLDVKRQNEPLPTFLVRTSTRWSVLTHTLARLIIANESGWSVSIPKNCKQNYFHGMRLHFRNVNLNKFWKNEIEDYNQKIFSWFSDIVSRKIDFTAICLHRDFPPA